MGIKQRRKREKEQRRRQILDASRTLLFKKGLNAISVNQIARQAELAVGTIYFYFRSKEEIFAALQEEGLLCKETHSTVIRVAPPLTIGREDIDWAVVRIAKVLTTL